MEERDLESNLPDVLEDEPDEAPQLQVSVSDKVLFTPRTKLGSGAQLVRLHSDPIRQKETVKTTPTAPPVLFRQIPSLRALSFQVYAPVVETFYCQICMENCAYKDGRCFTGNGECGHRFCKDCMSQFAVRQIIKGQTRIACPCIGATVEGTVCEAEATRADLEKLVTEDMLAKYDRFVTMQSNENHRDCPKCGIMFTGNPKSPQMVCPSCGTAFCFYHSNAHPNQSCREYARRMHRQDKDSRVTIVRITKACPNCRARVEKDGGCNHITCSCGCNWCWLCNRRMGERHFAPVNILGCPGAQFTETDSVWFTWLRKLLALMGCLLCLTFAIATSPIVAFGYFGKGKDLVDSFEFSVNTILLPLLYLIAGLIYVVYVPICFFVIVPIDVLWHGATKKEWPRKPFRALMFQFR